MSDIKRLAIGCEPLGGSDWGRVCFSELEAALNLAWEKGIRKFDTADVYGLGLSEKRISKVLGNRRYEAHITTKFGCRWSHSNGRTKNRARVWKDGSPSYIKMAVEDSLKRLKIDVIPTYLFHWPDPNVSLTQTLDALEELVQREKIVNYGLSNFFWKQYEPYLKLYNISTVQNSYNLLDRHNEATIVNASEHGLSTQTYGPLAQGLLTGKFEENYRFEKTDRRHRLPLFVTGAHDLRKNALNSLQTVSNQYNKTMAQTALRWLLDKTHVSTIIVGIKTSEQLFANLGSLDWKLSSTSTELLDSIITKTN